MRVSRSEGREFCCVFVDLLRNNYKIDRIDGETFEVNLKETDAGLVPFLPEYLVTDKHEKFRLSLVPLVAVRVGGVPVVPYYLKVGVHLSYHFSFHTPEETYN